MLWRGQKEIQRASTTLIHGIRLTPVDDDDPHYVEYLTTKIHELAFRVWLLYG